MTDQLPPDWAIEKALNLTKFQPVVGLDHFKRQLAQGQWSNICAFARYIAEHEEAPVDPLLIEAREIAAQRFRDTGNTAWVSEVLQGDHDDTSEVENALAGLRRGIEIGKGQP